MILRSSILMLAAACAAGAVHAQPTAPSADRAIQGFAFSLPGEGGYLGVQTIDVNKENFSKYGLSEVRGVAVEKVMENSPAAAAGLRDGDVIIRFDGDDVSSVRKLTRLISETAADHRVKITVLRGGAEQELTATIGKRAPMGVVPGSLNLPRMPGAPTLPDGPNVFSFPNIEGAAPAWRSGNARQIGVGVESLTKQLAAFFNVEGGLLVSEVRENSPAAKAGLRAGDIIVEANGKAVKNDIDLIRTIQEKKEGDVTIGFVRSGTRQTVSVTPETVKDGTYFFRTDGDGIAPTPPPPARVFTPGAMTLYRRGNIL